MGFVLANRGMLCVSIFLSIHIKAPLYSNTSHVSIAGEAFGLIMRVPLVNNQGSIGLYVAGNLPVVLSPACFLAFNYIVYGRLIPLLGRKYSLINPRIVGKLFIISDVVTFFIQVYVFLTRPPLLLRVLLREPSSQMHTLFHFRPPAEAWRQLMVKLLN